MSSPVPPPQSDPNGSDPNRPDPSTAGGPPPPVVLTSQVSVGSIQKMMIPLGIVLFVVTWMVVMLILGPLHVPMAQLVAVVISALFVAAMFVVKGKQLKGQQQVTTLELSPAGMRRSDMLVTVEIPWERVTGFSVENTLAKAVTHSPVSGSQLVTGGKQVIDAAANGRGRREVGILGGGVLQRRPGLGPLAGKQVVENYRLRDELPHERDRLLVTPGHFEPDWRSGQIGAHLRYHRPDLLIPATDDEVGKL